jgi:hypothetical protein
MIAQIITMGTAATVSSNVDPTRSVTVFQSGDPGDFGLFAAVIVLLMDVHFSRFASGPNDRGEYLQRTLVVVFPNAVADGAKGAP